MVWKNEEEELEKFLETLNCYHPTIKFTAEYSRAKINFLDVTVMKKGNQVATDLYVKPTDTYQYLHTSSRSVSHCKRSIHFSQSLPPFLIYDVTNWMYGSKNEVAATDW